MQILIFNLNLTVKSQLNFFFGTPGYFLER